MRVDCINDCLGEKIKKNNNKCLHGFNIKYVLWRNDSSYSSYHDLKLCEEDSNALINLMEEREQMRIDCESKCRSDCVNRYYKNQIKIRDPRRYYNSDMPLNTTRIVYYHNNIPDQVTEHLEKMSFVDFYGNFGGLVGVWLGFSIATVISDLMDIIRDKYLKNFIMPI